MKSPFPRMDPYLERRWGDFYVSLIVAMRGTLQPQLPRGLRARAEQDLLFEEQGEPTRYRGDVTLNEVGGQGGTAVAVPSTSLFTIEVQHERRPHRWVQIIDSRAVIGS